MQLSANGAHDEIRSSASPCEGCTPSLNVKSLFFCILLVRIMPVVIIFVMTLERMN